MIIVNFNAKTVLSSCLSSLQKVTDVKREVFVVDNASTDGSCEMVKKKFPEVKLIELEENVGFAAANNIGIQKSKGKYLLLLNPDTTVETGTFSIMLNYMEKYPRVGVSTCKIELATGGLDKDCRRSFPTPWVAFTHFFGLSRLFPKTALFGKYHLTYLPENEIHEVDSCLGAFMFVRRTAMEAVGLMDEEFFFYGEDLDWCYRFKQAGWLVTYNPHTTITHYKGYSSGLKKQTRKISTATIESRKKATKARFDAMRIFYRKHYHKKYPLFVTAAVLLAIEGKRFYSNMRIKMEERKHEDRS